MFISRLESIFSEIDPCMKTKDTKNALEPILMHFFAILPINFSELLLFFHEKLHFSFKHFKIHFKNLSCTWWYLDIDFEKLFNFLDMQSEKSLTF